MNETSYVIANMNELYSRMAQNPENTKKSKKNPRPKSMLSHVARRQIHIQSYWLRFEH